MFFEGENCGDSSVADTLSTIFQISYSSMVYFFVLWLHNIITPRQDSIWIFLNIHTAADNINRFPLFKKKKKTDDIVPIPLRLLF